MDAEVTGFALIIQDFFQVRVGGEHGERLIPVQTGLFRETGEDLMAAQVEMAAEIRAHEPPVHAGCAMGRGPPEEAVRIPGICRNGACSVHAREPLFPSHL